MFRSAVLLIYFVLIYLRCVYPYNYLNFTDWPETCKDGQISLQSPIDFSKALREPCKIDAFQFNFTFLEGPTNFRMEKNYSTYFKEDEAPIMLNASHIDSPAPTLYKLSEINFFAPSGHTFFSYHADLEMNLVFTRVASNSTKDQTEIGKYAIISMFFNRALHPQFKWNYTLNASEEDPLYNTTRAYFETQSFSGDFIGTLGLNSTGDEFSFKFKDIFDKPFQDASRYYLYKGSWTFPPCSQNVNWFVQDYIFILHPKYYEIFYQAWIANTSFSEGRGKYRDRQEIHGRTVCSINFGKSARRLSIIISASFTLLIFLAVLF